MPHPATVATPCHTSATQKPCRQNIATAQKKPSCSRNVEVIFSETINSEKKQSDDSSKMGVAGGVADEIKSVAGGSRNLPDDKFAFRNHCFKWRVGMYRFPKNFITGVNTRKLRSNTIVFVKKFDAYVLQIYTNCKKQCVVIELDKSVYANRMDIYRDMTLDEVKNLLYKLEHYGFAFDWNITRKQPNHNAMDVSHIDEFKKEPTPQAYHSKYGTTIFDRSLDKPEIEFIDDHKIASEGGYGLVQRIHNAPENIDGLIKVSENILKAFSVLLSRQTTANLQKTTEGSKDESKDSKTKKPETDLYS